MCIISYKESQLSVKFQAFLDFSELLEHFRILCEKFDEDLSRSIHLSILAVHVGVGSHVFLPMVVVVVLVLGFHSTDCSPVCAVPLLLVLRTKHFHLLVEVVQFGLGVLNGFHVGLCFLPSRLGFLLQLHAGLLLNLLLFGFNQMPTVVAQRAVVSVVRVIRFQLHHHLCLHIGYGFVETPMNNRLGEDRDTQVEPAAVLLGVLFGECNC